MARRSNLQSNAERSSKAVAQDPSQHIQSIELRIAERLLQDARFRERYLRTWAANEVATELRKMRKRRRLRQEDLAAQAGTGQSAISRIEKRDYDGWSFKTLLNIAGVLKARLRVLLEPLEDVADQHRVSESATASGGVMDSDVEATGETAQLKGGESTSDDDYQPGDASGKTVEMVM